MGKCSQVILYVQYHIPYRTSFHKVDDTKNNQIINKNNNDTRSAYIGQAIKIKIKNYLTK